MEAEDSDSPAGPGGDRPYTDVITKLATLANEAQDPTARASFGLLAELFRALSAGHDTFSARDAVTEKSQPKAQ